MYLCTWAHAQNHCTMEGLPRLGRCRIYEGEVFGRSGGRAGNVLLDLKISWCGGVDRSWGRGWGRGWGWAGAGLGLGKWWVGFP